MVGFCVFRLCNKKFEIERVFTPPARKKEEKKAKKNIGSSIIAFSILFVCAGALFGCLAQGAYMGRELFLTSYDKIVYTHIENKNFKIGEAVGHFTLKIDKEKDVSIDFGNTSTTPFVYKGDAYYYYTHKIEELTEEFKSLMPEGNSEKELEKYGEKMEKLAEKIEVYTEAFESGSFSYEQLNFDLVGV